MMNKKTKPDFIIPDVIMENKVYWVYKDSKVYYRTSEHHAALNIVNRLMSEFPNSLIEIKKITTQEVLLFSRKANMDLQ